MKTPLFVAAALIGSILSASPAAAEQEGPVPGFQEVAQLLEARGYSPDAAAVPGVWTKFAEAPHENLRLFVTIDPQIDEIKFLLYSPTCTGAQGVLANHSEPLGWFVATEYAEIYEMERLLDAVAATGYRPGRCFTGGGGGW